MSSWYAIFRTYAGSHEPSWEMMMIYEAFLSHGDTPHLDGLSYGNSHENGSGAYFRKAPYMMIFVDATVSVGLWGPCLRLAAVKSYAVLEGTALPKKIEKSFMTMFVGSYFSTESILGVL